MRQGTKPDLKRFIAKLMALMILGHQSFAQYSNPNTSYSVTFNKLYKPDAQNFKVNFSASSTEDTQNLIREIRLNNIKSNSPFSTSYQSTGPGTFRAEPVWVASESEKDKKSQVIKFKMASSEDPEKFVWAEFKYDPSQVNNLANLRVELQAKQEEATSKRLFAQKYFNLPSSSQEDIMAYILALPKDKLLDFEKDYQEKRLKEVENTKTYFRDFLKTHFKMPKDATPAQIDAFYNNPKIHPVDREELDRMAKLKHQTALRIARDSFTVTFSRSQHGFLSQTALFGVAQGAVIWLECQKQISYNPLCAKQMIDGMTDPIGQVAFASFIMANRFTTDMITRRYGGVSTPTANFMRTALPYIGLSAGMFVSNLSAEVLNLMKVCAQSMMGKDQRSLQVAQDPCNAAQKEFFNVENKVEQYIPMLISMAASTYMLVKLVQGAPAVRVGAQVFAQSAIGQRIAGTTFVKSLATRSQPAMRIVGMTLAIRVSPGGWVLNGMSVGMILFQVVQNAAFLKLDHHFLPFLNKAWGQLWRAKLVDNSEENLKEILLLNQKSGWDPEKNYRLQVQSGKNPRRISTGDLVPAIKRFREQMEAWRMVNHSKIFIGLQSWSQITNDLIRKLNATELFYRAYFNRVFEAFKFEEKRKSPQGLDGDEQRRHTLLPFRTYPLYKVIPSDYNECESGEEEEYCTTELGLYMNYPDDLERFQKISLKRAVDAFRKQVLTRAEFAQIRPDASVSIQALLKQLEGEDRIRLGQAIQLLKKYATTSELRDERAQVSMFMLWKTLGQPEPNWIAGSLFPILFEQSVQKIKVFDGLEPESRSAYRFQSYTEYLLYQMMCGPSTESSNTMIEVNPGWAPKFRAPKVISGKNLKVQFTQNFGSKPMGLTSLCQPVTASIPFNYLYSAQVFEQGQSKGQPFLTYLASHLNPQALGNWKNTDRDSATNFHNWWSDNVRTSMVEVFKELDFNYQNLLLELANALNSEDFFASSENQSEGLSDFEQNLPAPSSPEEVRAQIQSKSIKMTHAGRSLIKTHIQEINVYLTILSEIEGLTSSQATRRRSQIEEKKTLLEQMTMPPYARIESQKELADLLQKVASAVESMRIVQNPNGPNTRIATMNMPIKEFNNTHDDLIEALSSYKEHLGTLKLTEKQREAAQVAVESLEASASALGVYVFNTQLTNFSMSQDLEEFLRNVRRAREGNADKKTLKQNTSPFSQ